MTIDRDKIPAIWPRADWAGGCVGPRIAGRMSCNWLGRPKQPVPYWWWLPVSTRPCLNCAEERRQLEAIQAKTGPQPSLIDLADHYERQPSPGPEPLDLVAHYALRPPMGPMARTGAMAAQVERAAKEMRETGRFKIRATATATATGDLMCHPTTADHEITKATDQAAIDAATIETIGGRLREWDRIVQALGIPLEWLNEDLDHVAHAIREDWTREE